MVIRVNVIKVSRVILVILVIRGGRRTSRRQSFKTHQTDAKQLGLLYQTKIFFKKCEKMLPASSLARGFKAAVTASATKRARSG